MLAFFGIVKLEGARLLAVCFVMGYYSNRPLIIIVLNVHYIIYLCIFVDIVFAVEHLL